MDKRTFFWLFALTSIVYAFGFVVEIMGVDSAQYALISREMAESGEFLQVHLRGQDYLDKPPLLFWITSLFFKLLGYSNWSFKIGSFLFTLLGVFSTFRLTRLLYSKETAYLAAIILYTCQAFFLFNNDVRTDTILTGSVIFAIWQLVEWLHENRWKWLLGAALGIALAMLAKGPIGLMVPILATSSYLVGQGRWRDFVRWQYLVLIVVVALLLSPMLWGLYTQFDLHPEKSVFMPSSNGMTYRQNVSGLRFYLWTQSFGRITGESDWSDGSGPLFFVHNLLWAFLPWAFLFVIAFFWRLVRVIKASFQNGPLPELLTLGGFILPFIAFSMSSYKLPHYIFVLFPLAAILVAVWWGHVWQKRSNKAEKVVALILQFVVLIVSGLVIYLIYFQYFPGAPDWKLLLSLLLLVLAALFMMKGLEKKMRIIIASVLVSLSANFTLNAWFYPQVLTYQVGEEMAEKVKQLEIPKEEVYLYNYFSFSLTYYLEDSRLPLANDELIEEQLNKGKEVFLITSDPYLQDIMSDFDSAILYQMGRHSATRLSLRFLEPDTRAATLDQVYLIKILKKKEDENNQPPQS